MRRLVADNGVDADLTGHASGLNMLMLAALAGGAGLFALIGLLIWLNRLKAESGKVAVDVSGTTAARPRSVERSDPGGGFGRRKRND